MRIVKDLNISWELGETTEIKEIVKAVKKHGDKALREYTARFDGVSLKEFKIDISENIIDQETQDAIKSSAEMVRKFSEKQLAQLKDFEYKPIPGVFLGQRVIPIRRVGIYVPGGFPLVSTLIMCGVPAKVAGVKEIIVCSPPSFNGTIHPTILAAARYLNINEIYAVGGPQAIAAMAYGTKTINKVDKIVGPGSIYVNLAKKEVFGDVGIDFIAGPTEVLIIADEAADPQIIASDLLAQAEHDKNALPILVTTCEKIAKEVNKTIDTQMQELSTKNTAKASIEGGAILLVDDIDDAITAANRIAPEHLELQVKDPENYVDRLTNYGTLFIGELSAVALGDYSSGLNHTLPTNTGARYTGGLSVKDFLKLQTTLRVTEKGFSEIAPVAKKLAEIEGLDGHIKSIEQRRS